MDDGLFASNIRFIVQSLPANEDQFQEKIRALDKGDFSSSASEDVPLALNELQRHQIKQCVVGPRHLAFLLSDGRVCRLKYFAHSIHAEEEAEYETTATASKTSQNKSGERPFKALRRTSDSPWVITGADLLGGHASGSSSALRRWGTRIGVIRSAVSTSSSSSLSPLTTTASSAARNRSRNGSSAVDASLSAGVRLLRTSQLRGRGLQSSLLTGQRVIVPASHVPEELVNQVQGILQGKSRSIIIRELQRTNLDVNLAVNNLLSRDDEDNEDMDESGSDYIPGDDLLSLLDSGMHSRDHGLIIDTDTVLPEELLGYTFHRTARNSSQRCGNSNNNDDYLRNCDPIIRLGSPRSPRWFESLRQDASVSADAFVQSKTTAPAKKAKVTTNSSEVIVGEQLEWWTDEEGIPVKFSQIGAMQTELAAVDFEGSLRQWRWEKEKPYRHSTNLKIFHPRSLFLNLEDKKVTQLASCPVRSSVLIESGAVATWMDESIARHASVLEHPASNSVSPELAMDLQSEKWKASLGRCIFVCSLYTAVFTSSGNIYWWGVLPFIQRRKLLERAQAKLKKNLTVKKTTSQKPEIKVGSLVCLHTCPLFQAGAIAIHTRGGKPKVGCIQQSVWNLTDKCTFKVLSSRKKNKRSKGIGKDKAENKSGKKKSNFFPPTSLSASSETAEKPQAELTAKKNDEKPGTTKGQSAAPCPSPTPNNSERETVLKSTSSASILGSQSAPSKSQKRKRTSSPSYSLDRPRLKKHDVLDEDADDDDGAEEQWNLQDVVFIEDVQTVPVGKVLKIDGDMVAVWFSHSRKSSKFDTADMDPASILENCRLLRKEDLHLLPSVSPPRIPDCFLKTPKKIPLDASLKIHSICVNETGIKAVEGGTDGSPLTLLDIGLDGKVTSDCPFPTPADMFFSKGEEKDGKVSSAISEDNSAKCLCEVRSQCQDFPTLFQDRYSTLYPLLRNENCGFRDPRWMNLPPLQAIGVGAHIPRTLDARNEGTQQKSLKMIVVTALVFEAQQFIPIIVRRDCKGVREFLRSLPPNFDTRASLRSELQLHSICKEKCDGQRNLMHVAVAMTAPSPRGSGTPEEDSSKKDKDEGNKEKSKGESYKVLSPVLTSLSSSTATTASRDSNVRSSALGGASTARSTSGSHFMSLNERANAVSAIANAISVVTRGSTSENSQPRTTSAASQREPRHPPAFPDPISFPEPSSFLLPLPYPSPYIPLSSSSTSSTSSFSSSNSIIMRDIMQQFAAVLDDHPPSSSGPPPSVSTPPPVTATAPTSSSNSRMAQSIMNEIRNVFNASPQPPRRRSPSRSPSPRLSPCAIPTLSWPPEPDPLVIDIPDVRVEGLNLSVVDSPASSGRDSRPSVKKNTRKRSANSPKHEASTSNVKVTTRHGSFDNSIEIVQILCQSDEFFHCMVELLSERDAFGHTPFMSAVYHRAYPAANAIMMCAGLLSNTAGTSQSANPALMKMIYPPGSNPDDNPLYMVCANDTCSFTWTGAHHINQDIFECWTCGLTGTLCCCSECARVCHNGHDCKLKRTSPTAYCDCWQKCSCRSLVAGDSEARKQLLVSLLYVTELVNLPNARGETLLQFLAQTVARQMTEQRQYRTRSNASSSRSTHPVKTTIAGVEYEAPQHDLPPPIFCRDSFQTLLQDWTSIKATVITGCPGYVDALCASSLPDIPGDSSQFLLPEELMCMASQTGTSRLDAFVLCLLVKCNTEHLDMLLETISKHIQKEKNPEDRQVAHRFMRSLIRVFVVMSIETQPGKQVGRSACYIQPMKKAQRAFHVLLPIAVKEFCEVASSLIAPVRMGVVRPTSPFPLLTTSTEAIQSCEAAFAHVPFPPRSKAKKKKGGKKNERGRNSSGPLESSSTRPVSRGNYGRRGISHRRIQNLGSTRVGSSLRNESASQENNSSVVVINEGFTADEERNRAEEASGRVGDEYVLLSEEEDQDGAAGREGGSFPEWESNEDAAEHHEGDGNREDLSLSVLMEHGDDVDQRSTNQPGQETNDQEQTSDRNVQNTDDGSNADETPRDIVSEGDLEMEEEEEEDDNAREEDAADEDDEDNAQDEEESDMDLTLLAGSEADSDAESNQSVGRDILKALDYYLDEDEQEDDLDDDEGDDDNADEDRDSYTLRRASEEEATTATDVDVSEASSQEDNDAEGDREEQEEEMESQSEWIELPLERAPTRQQRSRAAQTPHSMRWALGPSRNSTGRQGAGPSSSRPAGPGTSTGSGNLIYIDPTSLRRGSSLGVNSSVTPSSSNSGPDRSKSPIGMAGYSTATTTAQLARAFSICVRELSGLLVMVDNEDLHEELPSYAYVATIEAAELKQFVDESLAETWSWLITVIDSTEAQLRYGHVLSLASSPDHVGHPLYKGPAKGQNKNSPQSNVPEIYRRGAITSVDGRSLSFMNTVRMTREATIDSSAARQDFLSYILSLMRANSNEHSDLLPVIDVSALRHVAYVLDAYIFFLRETSVSDNPVSNKKKKMLWAVSSDPEELDRKLSLNIGYDNTDDEDEEEEDNGIIILEEPEPQTLPDDLSEVLVDNIISSSLKKAQEESDPVNSMAQPLKSFFRRSNSMTFLGCTDPDPFSEPMVTALPLADKPHLLQPNARKEELFGRPRQHPKSESTDGFFDPNLPSTGMGLVKRKIPVKFANIGKKLSGNGKGNSASSKVSKKSDSDQKELSKSEENETQSRKMDTTEDKSDGKEAAEEVRDIRETEEVLKKDEKAGKESNVVPANIPVIVKNEKPSAEDEKPPGVHKSQPSVDRVLGRCRLTLELFTRVFLDDVGAEPKSVLQELGGFEVREQKFRKEMEKVRNCQSVDLQLNVERDPRRLVLQTFKQLNQHYRRRSSPASSSSQPLAVHRVKVIFKDEPGEGSGVARSFYTALCEALLSSEKLPPLDSILVPSGSSSIRGTSAMQNRLISRLRKREQERERERAGGRSGSSAMKVNLRSYFLARYSQRSSTTTSSTMTTATSRRTTPTSVMPGSLPQMSTLALPFHKRSSSGASSRPSDHSDWANDKNAIGERLLPRVATINSNWSRKITGMLLSLPISELLMLLSSENMLKIKVADAVRRLLQVGYHGEEEHESTANEGASHQGSIGEASSSSSSGQRARMTVLASSKSSAERPSASSTAETAGKQKKYGRNQDSDESDHGSEDEEFDISTFPLFYQPGKRGFYSPAAGPAAKKQSKKGTATLSARKSSQLGYEARLSAFRNVGRILGLCLLQNELCPLPLNRHVLKALLGRKINWLDFAFFDPTMYESMRFMLAECAQSEDENVLEDLDITFTADILPEEGGPLEVELIPGGSSVGVTKGNVHDFVRKYTTYKMITCCHKYIEQMRSGLFDVLPANALDDLTAEDLRLLANGCGRVNVHMLISYTSFNDESGKAGSNTEKLTEFKRWFWSVVEQMGLPARQELLYFWTGSPALPASEDGFQPMPTVTIRPPDDQHLPTANTCISRLYVPLYSSKLILKKKLSIAIQTKNFGFV